MNTIDLIKLLLAFGMIGCCFFAITKSSSNKSEMLNAKIKRSQIQFNIFDKQIQNLTSGTGKVGDGIELFKREMKLGLICLLAFLLFAFILSFPLLAIPGFVVVVYPIFGRVQDKKEYKKSYLSSFNKFLTYLSLYLSSGLQFEKAIENTYESLDDKEVIKERLSTAISNKKVTGVTGSTYVEYLQILNDGFEYQEISTFLNTCKRAQERGDAIADVIVGQADDLRKKNLSDKKAFIAERETSFEMYKMLFGFMPTFAAFGLPIFLSAIASFG